MQPNPLQRAPTAKPGGPDSVSSARTWPHPCGPWQQRQLFRGRSVGAGSSLSTLVKSSHPLASCRSQVGAVHARSTTHRAEGSLTLP